MFQECALATATCGREVRCTSCTREIAAPIMTPRRSPEPSTPRRVAIATMKSARFANQSCVSAVTWNNPAMAISTMAARTG